MGQAIPEEGCVLEFDTCTMESEKESKNILHFHNEYANSMSSANNDDINQFLNKYKSPSKTSTVTVEFY